MKGITDPTSQHSGWRHRKIISLAVAALSLLLLLLVACVPQNAGSHPTVATLTPTTRPQTAAPTATLHPTVTADRAETIDCTTQPTPELPDETTLPTLNSTVVGEVPPELLENLIADLAERLEISNDQITVVHSEAVEWNDGSLGCPQPGMVYLQVVTPGFRVVLAGQDQLYDYHSDTKAHFILCNPDGVIADPPPLLPILPDNKPPNCKFPPCK
jgi:hypothetical protein